MTKIYIYAFRERSAIINLNPDINKFVAIDLHLIRAMHIESLYDILVLVGELDLDYAKEVLSEDILQKLQRYQEVVLKGEEASRLLKKLNMNIECKYLILRTSLQIH